MKHYDYVEWVLYKIIFLIKEIHKKDGGTFTSM